MKFSMIFKQPDDDAGSDVLSQAIGATRGLNPKRTLSTDTRARILDAAQCQSEPAREMFPALFTAPRRLVAAGILPLVLAMGLLVMLNQGRPVAPDSPSTTVHAVKQGDQVHFNIANGSRSHFVYRSTVPDRFEASSAVRVTDGAFVDAVDDQADLVFYRID
jgi:hypothetical protein